MDNANKLFLGIDGGGTKCKARLEDFDGKLLAEAITGPANAARDLNGSINSILEASKQCLVNAGLPEDRLADIHAGIGLAGISLPSVKSEFEKVTLPFVKYAVTTDLHIACLGAHAGKDGVIVIVGTGSSGIAIKEQQQRIMGGHGFLVGDKGSGAWIGKMAVSHCLETLDGIVAPNQLSEAIMLELKCSSAMDLVMMSVSAPPAFFARLAPLVFEQAQNGQVDAKQLISESAEYIAALSANLLSHSSGRLSYIGGVSKVLLAYLPQSIQNKVSPPCFEPESGAIFFIKSILNTENQS